MAMIWRKKDFGDVDEADPRVGHLITDQFFQLLADVFRETLRAVRVQLSEYNSRVKAILLACCAICGAQTVDVYSEFARIDTSGKVTSPETPREILSPMLVRNGFTSFQVVVHAPAGKRWQLHIGQNPENAVEVTMYRESGDELTPAALPIDGEGTQVLWMDLWSSASAKVQRIKVEPELNIDSDWVLYPIEGRVVDAVVPERPAGISEGPTCGLQWGTPRIYIAGQSVPGMHFRNATQDSALEQQHRSEEFNRLATDCTKPASDPERYLRIRDYLLSVR